MIDHHFSIPDVFKIVNICETKGGFEAHVRARNKLGPLGYGFGSSVDEAVRKASANLADRLHNMPVATSEPSAPAALSGLRIDISRLTRR